MDRTAVGPQKPTDDTSSEQAATHHDGRTFEVVCDLPDRPAVTSAERRLLAAYFGAVIASILAEDP